MMTTTMNCPECGGTLNVETNGRVSEIKHVPVPYGARGGRRTKMYLEAVRVERQGRYAMCNECEFTHEF